MIKNILAGASALVLSCGVANAALVDSFDLDTTTAAGTDSNIALNAGETYTVTISGTFFYTVGTGLEADAEYILFDTGPSSTNTSGQERGVAVDGVDVDLGAYSPINTYTFTLVGDGTTSNFTWVDGVYSDNAGSLLVEIFNDAPEVPLPAAAWFMGAGLAAYGASRRKKSA